MTKLTAWIGRGARFTAVLAGGLALGACTYLFDPDYETDAPRPPVRTVQGEARAPNLGSVPPRPDGTTSAEERRAIQQGLIADRENARYTDETLRGRPASAAPASTPRTAAPAPAPARAPEPQMPPVAAPSRPAAVPPPQPAATRQPATPVAPAAASQVAAAPAPASAADRRIPSIVQDSPPPVAPAAPVAPTSMAPVAATSAATPQRPMTLAEVFQQQVAVAHRNTIAGLPGAAPAAAPVPPPAAAPAVAAPAAQPQQMALAGGAGMTAPTMIPVQGAAAASVGQPPAVPARGRAGLVPFGASTNRVDPGATPFLRQVAEQARATAARVRVVGHSPVASNASANDKLLAFGRASEQAETVAAELVRLGLPADAVLIEARSGAGAASGAEIFLEN